MCGGQRGRAMEMLTNPEMKSSIHHHHLFVAIINITIIIIAASKDRVVGINLSTILTDKSHTIKVSATLHAIRNHHHHCHHYHHHQYHLAS